MRAASAAGSNASGGLGNVPEAAEVTAPKKHAVIEPQEDFLSAGNEDPKALGTLDLRRTPSEQQIKERHDDIMHGPCLWLGLGLGLWFMCGSGSGSGSVSLSLPGSVSVSVSVSGPGSVSGLLALAQPS
eukprot:2467535-Rhodomonas_salina.1